MSSGHRPQSGLRSASERLGMSNHPRKVAALRKRTSDTTDRTYAQLYPFPASSHDRVT